MEVDVTEFPFVQGLTKREALGVSEAWQALMGLIAYTKEHGRLVPVSLAAAALGVGRTRIDELVFQGRLQRVDVWGHVFIGGRSLEVHAQAIRSKGGRPWKSLKARALSKKAC